MNAVSRELARFAVAPGEVPEPARHAGRRTVANSVALSTGAGGHEAADLAVATLTAVGRGGNSTVFGRGERLGIADAALVNGLTAHVEDFDDTHLQTVIHPGAPVVPAAIAAAEWMGASGEQTLLAVVCGIEVALRVGNGITPEHFDRGWHLTSTTGRLGAAVAAGRLLGLDEDAMLVALGAAAVEAAGLQEALGTMTKSFHPGKAAADGLEAAFLAAAGFTGPEAPIEGRRGFARTASARVDEDAMLAGLGERWEIERNAFKPYACGIVSHPVIDAAVALRERLTFDEIDEVEVTVNPVVLDVMGVADPRDGLQSKFSVYHCFAVGFLDGAGGPAQFSDDRATATQVVALRGRVRVTTDPAIAKDAALATVATVDGDRLTHEVAHASGSEASPMTDEQLRAKARLVAAPALGEEGAEALGDLAFRLDTLTDVTALLAATRPLQERHA